MKKVISGGELQDRILKAINLLCGTVKKTLGPLGKNVIIDHSAFSPYITNDGVTIAENIESDDPVINTILSLIKEAAIKTNEVVGDGTTTTLVLLESIYKLGLEKLQEGTSIYKLKGELEGAVNKVINLLNEEKIVINDSIYTRVATVASGSEEIGKLISNLYLKYNDALEIKEGILENDTWEEYNGYYFESILASPYFLNGVKELKCSKTYILLVDKVVNNIEILTEIINFVIDNNSSLLIVAKDYGNNVVEEILNFNYENNANIILVKCPEYGYNQVAVLKDMEIFSDATIKRLNSEISKEDLGVVDGLIVNDKVITLINTLNNSRIEKYVNKLSKELNSLNDMFEKEFLWERIGKFKNGKAVIKVGGITTSEIKEKKMRFDDALCALNSLKDGALIGGGYSFIKVSDKLDVNNDGLKIIKESLKSPFQQLLSNAGIEASGVLKKIKDSNYSLVYNLAINKYEDVNDTKIIDSYNVVITSLKNACSIATLLLSTFSLVINEYKVENKINFNEEI